jgi:hypothetical protein
MAALKTPVAPVAERRGEGEAPLRLSPKGEREVYLMPKNENSYILFD